MNFWKPMSACGVIAALVISIGCSTTRDGITYEKTGTQLKISRGPTVLSIGTLVETYDNYGRKVWRWTFTTGPRNGTSWNFDSLEQAEAFLQELLRSGVFEWDDGSVPDENEIDSLLGVLSDYWVDPDPIVNP